MTHCSTTYMPDFQELRPTGDVFGVTVQTLFPCDACDACDCEEWVDGESLWGIYADDAEEAARYFAIDYASI